MRLYKVGKTLHPAGWRGMNVRGWCQGGMGEKIELVADDCQDVLSGKEHFFTGNTNCR